MSVPVCPVCCDTLGRNGGPTTLPCGHNGCLHCMEACQAHHSECPLCRAPFEPDHKLTLNHQLRDLVAMATRLQLDEESRREGWEAFPSPKIAAKHYSKELEDQRTAAECPPTAPPLQDSHVVDVLSLEPPPWVPDSASDECMSCHQTFQAIIRTRHHCRLCGKIYCHRCSSKQMLLPPKFNCREPKRVCELCASILEPCQSYLAASMSVASQQPVHDVINMTSIRAYINNPLTSSLAGDIYKCSNVLYAFGKAQRLFPKIVSSDVLRNVAGVAVISEVKVGFGFWSGRLGTGLVVSRLSSGEWSAPSAIFSSGAGWGLQAGGELSDIVIILPNRNAVEAFTGDARVTIGGAVSLSVGVGGSRQTQTSIKLKKSGSSAECYIYGLNRGLFAGLSVEGAVIRTRDGINHNFYGLPVTAESLLSGTGVKSPAAAAVLYEALHTVFDNVSVPIETSDVEPKSVDVAELQGDDLCCSAISAQSHAYVARSELNVAESMGLHQLYNSTHSIHGQEEGLRVTQEGVDHSQDGEAQLVGAW